MKRGNARSFILGLLWAALLTFLSRKAGVDLQWTGGLVFVVAAAALIAILSVEIHVRRGGSRDEARAFVKTLFEVGIATLWIAGIVALCVIVVVKWLR